MSETSTHPAAGEAARIHAGSLVWDMVFPLEPWCGNDWDKLARFHRAGYDMISITLAGDNHSISQAVQRVAAARREVLGRPDEWPGKDDPAWPGFTYAVPEDGVRVTELIVRQGYDVNAIRKILGENYLRICGEVWR